MNDKAETPKLLLSTAEAAKMLSISRDSLYRILWRDGPDGIRSVRVGKMRRIPVAELRRWVDHQMAEEYGDEPPPNAA